jgi:hypothetical protein
MTAMLCPACPKPSQDGALCQGEGSCTELLERTLGDVPALASAAVVGYAGQARVMRLAVGAQPPEDDEALEVSVKLQPLPWDEGISKAVRALHAELSTTVRLVIEETRIPSERVAGPVCLLCTHRSCRSARAGGWPVDSLPAMSWWLLAHHVGWLRAHPAAKEILRGLADAVARLESTQDRAPELIYAGPCEAVIVDDGVTRQCGHDVYAEVGAASAECPACRTPCDVAARRDTMSAAVDAYVLTATEVSRALTALDDPVTPERIRKWAERSQLVSVGVALRGDRLDPTYRVGDVRKLLAEAAAAAERKLSRLAGVRRSA